MADKKISALTLKTTPVGNDETVIVDTSTSLNKKVKLKNLPVSSALSTALSSKMNKAGDSVTGEYVITHSDTDPVTAISIQNKNTTYLSALGLVNDVDGNGIAIVNSAASFPPADPGDVVLGFSGVASGNIFLTDKNTGFKLWQGGVKTLDFNTGILWCRDLNAAPLNINALSTKTTPVNTDEVEIYDVTALACKKSTFSTFPITTAESARLTNFQDSLGVRYTPSAATSSTTNVLIDSYLIPANTLSAQDVIDFKTLILEKVGVTNSGAFQIFVNTSNTLTGATAIVSSIVQAANLYGSLSRKFWLSGGNIYSMSLSSTNSDVTAVGTAWASAAFNPTVNNYILLAIRVTNAADSFRCYANQVDAR